MRSSSPTPSSLRAFAIGFLLLIAALFVAQPVLYPGAHNLWADTYGPGGGTIRDR